MTTVYIEESDPRLEHVSKNLKCALPRLKEVAVYCEGPNWLEAVTSLPESKMRLLVAMLVGAVGDERARELCNDLCSRHP